MITAVSIQQALKLVERSLLLREGEPTAELSDELIAQAARRASHIMAPCAKHELSRALVQSFAALGIAEEELAERIADTLEQLIIYGDILEMRNATDSLWSRATSFVLRPAPPSFVVRKNSSVVILGVAGDEISLLTGDLEERVVHRGVLRILSPNGGEDLQGLLRELGLTRLPEKNWLHLPKLELANAYEEAWRQALDRGQKISRLEGLRILDTAKPPTFYRDRWCQPERKHNGMFVARRPQRYGSDIWCLVDLDNGSPKTFTDLTAPGDRLRPFDLAWRIQAAFDAVVGAPQQYRCSGTDGSFSILRFYSPLPSWAERHLAIVGTKTKADRCLFSYEIPKEELNNETKSLRELLWMVERAE